MSQEKEQELQESGTMASFRLKGASHHVLCLVEEQVARLLDNPPAWAGRSQAGSLSSPEFWRL